MKKLILLVTLFSFFLPVTGFSMSYTEISNAYHNSFKYEKEKDYDNSIKAIIPVFESYPKGYTVNLRLGWLYYLKGAFKNSKVHYNKALSIVPTSVEAMLGLSLPLIAQKRWEDVVKLMYKILKIDYYNFYGNLRLSLALRNLSKYSEAQKIDEKMLAIYPANVTFLTELAVNIYKQGKYTYAKSLFGDVLTLDPENSVAKMYLKKIEEVKKK